MRNTINKLHKKLNGFHFYRQVCLFVRTFARVSKVLVPALGGAYLVYVYEDKLIIGIGVAAMLYALLVLVNSAYLAEASINKKR